MIHARPDYMRIQDPALRDRNLLPDANSTPIGEDEPVMLFRAQDKFFNAVLLEYYKLLIDGGKEDMAAMVLAHMKNAAAWQGTHGSKMPDVPEARP